MRRVLAVLLACSALAHPALAAQPQFWTLEGARDFLDGELEGLSVDSQGRLRLAPATRALGEPGTPYVWALARDKGLLYAGTGNDGQVLRIDGSGARVLFDAPELEVHALAVGPDGRLYAGTSPDGKVYAIDAAGKAEVFYDPADRYIWALAFAPGGDLIVATGAEAKVIRVDPKGRARVLLSTPETHITALAVGAEGTIYAGSSPGGVLYRIDPGGKVFVLHDSPFREVKALALGPDGSLWAALVEGKDGSEAARPPTPAPSPSPAASPGPTAEVTVTETLTAVAAPSLTVPVTVTAGSGRAAARGAVLRVLPGGEVDTVWTSPDEMPFALIARGRGVLVGTGNKGKIYEIREDRGWTMVAAVAGEQVTALAPAPDGTVAVATANPGRVYELAQQSGTRGTLSSKVKDTDTVSSWGRLRFEGSLPSGTGISLQSRSGNTGSPDSTWSDWSAAYEQPSGQAVTSPPARFLQLRVLLTGRAGESPVLDTVSVAYLQRNLRPEVTSITVSPPGEVFQKPLSLTGEIELMGVDPGAPVPGGSPAGNAAAGGPRSATLPAATTYARKLYQRGMQTFTWKAEDPNGDTLVYDVEYRALEDTRFRPLRKGLTEAVLTWDTTTVPNGRYVIRVTASDAPANPRGLALTSSEESAPFDVDNTPPAVTLALVGGKVRGTARDDSSLIRRAEYSVDGGRWQDVYPVDGINDSREETYEFVPETSGPGPHVVVLRAADLLGNVASARVNVP